MRLWSSIKQANTLISKIDNDDKLSDSELRLVKRVGLGLDNGKNIKHEKSNLEYFRYDKESALEHKELLASAYREINGILNEENKSKIVDSNKSNFVHDSSNITGETEPFDFMDLDG